MVRFPHSDEHGTAGLGWRDETAAPEGSLGNRTNSVEVMGMPNKPSSPLLPFHPLLSYSSCGCDNLLLNKITNVHCKIAYLELLLVQHISL